MILYKEALKFAKSINPNIKYIMASNISYVFEFEDKRLLEVTRDNKFRWINDYKYVIKMKLIYKRS